MAAFNFPNSPSTNDIHTENGVSWKWNGTIWARVASAGDTIEKGNTKVEVIDTGSDGHIKFTTEGTERLRIHENGTISTNVDNDSYEFTIQGKTGGSPTLWLRDGGTTGTPRVIFGDTNAAAVGAVAYANNGDYMQFKTGGVELVRFTNNAGSAGKVGIGSEIPVSKFDVADGTTGISFNRTNNTPEIHFRSNNVDECGEIRVGESSGGGVMDFKTKTTGGTLTTRLSIDTIGNLVTGAQTSPTSSDTGNIYIKNGSTIGSVGVAINYATNAVFDSAWKYISNGGASKIIQNASLVSFNFVGSGSAGGGITWSEKVRIDSSGNVGINESSPNRLLYISSNSSTAYSGTSGTNDAVLRLHNKNGTFRKYWNGWWFSKKCRYCIGFVVQVICVAPNGVMTQLYEEEWKGDPFDKPEQMFNFIQNIENFYNNYQCDIDKYLEVAMGPRSTHKYGRSIIAPSGSGKSTYIMNQQSPNAILDCDPMTWACNAQPHAGNKCPWDWNKDMRIICIQVDAAVQYCKQKRLWIMGATWWDPSIIDVVVILDEDLHRQYFLAKEDPFPPSYFEATIKKKVIPQLRKDAKEYNIPIYESLKDAEFYIRSLEQPLSF